MQKMPVNIVWFKRDFRISDHAPLQTAVQSGLPTFLFCFLEPSVANLPEVSTRHLRFMYESYIDLQNILKPLGHRIYLFHAEVLSVLTKIIESYEIKHIFSHQESHLAATFERDKQVAAWCKQKGIMWREFPQDGVLRGLKHREGWTVAWEKYMFSEQANPDLHKLKPCSLPKDLWQILAGNPIPEVLLEHNTNFQPGGQTYAQRYISSFFSHRGKNYNRHISKPALSRKSCSRISPYLAWGNISPRQVVQLAELAKKEGQLGRVALNFQSRLWWRSHYIQKFESDCRIEVAPLNPAFSALEKPLKPNLVAAWATGNTGYPMVDASMRALEVTGFINFRMRAMLATFFCFTLWQDWKIGATHLARLFLDFEPGIHFPQFHMQAGITGYHPLRIYNPVVQAERHDPSGDFVRQWLPALAKVPAPLIYQPWKMTALEQDFYQCKIGKDYPRPIVDFETATRKAKDTFWAFRNADAVKACLPEVWKLHCLPENREIYSRQLS